MQTYIFLEKRHFRCLHLLETGCMDTYISLFLVESHKFAYLEMMTVDT
jgi:hypothetical protein